MNKSFLRRTAANLRASLVIVAFTVLAAVGFATTKSIQSSASTPQSTPSAARETRGVPTHTAPAACPMPAGVFHVR